jgi:hydrogenase nickel incorporation protein HypA/HybF
VHELSIAQYLIESACDAAAAESAQRVTRLSVRIGAMSGVVHEALQFSFSLAAEGTLCDGALLEIEDVPVTVHCPNCDRSQTLADCWSLVCPTCGTSTPQLLTGRELDLVSIEIAQSS